MKHNNELFFGDISGCKKTFFEMVEENKDRMIVAVGDLNDRGEDSCGVIEFFIKHKEHLALLGNHEHMRLKSYMEAVYGNKNPYFSIFWIYVNGGKETLESYGIEVPKCRLTRKEITELYQPELEALMKEGWYQDLLKELKKIPKSHIDFLKTLPLKYETDYVFASHAPIRNWNNPKLFDINAIDKDRFLLDKSALWNRDDPNKPRKDGKLVIYGHQNKTSPLVHSNIYPIGKYLGKGNQLPDRNFWGLCLDTVKAGYLTAYDIKDNKFIYKDLKT